MLFDSFFNHYLNITNTLNKALSAVPEAFWLIWFINQTALYNHALSPIYAHQIFSDSDLKFLNGSHFGTFL